MSFIPLGVLAASGAGGGGSFESIATATGNSGTEVSFTSIPSTYKHLQIRFYAARNGGNGQLNMRFNSDTGTNYSTHYLYGNGTSAAAGGIANDARIEYIASVKDSAYDYKGVGIVDILDYANTSKYKTVKNFSGVDINASGGSVWLTSGSWRNTAAITSITFDLLGDDFGTSTFALYGIKG